MLLLSILLFGTVVGGLARLLLPGRQNLSLSATTVAGLLGAATVGSAVAAFAQRGFDAEAPSPSARQPPGRLHRARAWRRRARRRTRHVHLST